MPQSDYDTLVAEYAAELNELFAPESTREVGRPPAAASLDELADRAERLAPRAADLSRRTADFLSDSDPVVRLGAEQNLLAQAAAALRVADGLLVAGGESAESGVRSVGAEAAPAFDDLLALIQAPLVDAAAMATVDTAERRTRSAQATAGDLLTACDVTIGSILSDVGAFGSDTVAGLVGLDMALLKQAAKLIGGEVSELIATLGEQASRLVAKALAFILQAYDSILATLGEDLTGELRQKAAEWIERLQSGGVLTTLLGSAFETGVTRARLAGLVESSPAAPQVLGRAQEAVEALPAGYEARTKLAGKILAGLGILKRIPAARIPQIELASAAAYFVLLGYVAYTGGDYVDAPRLEKLGRVPGVYHVVEAALAA